ncbi:MAG: AAA family ATPase [Proteobacteria bacterium]|nr:AAA family ATPase [Pseudomonadota bacterium]
MIIIINGCINSGKTTLGKELHKHLPNSTFIDVDYIFGDRNYYEENKHKLKINFSEYCMRRLFKMIEVGNKLSKKDNFIVFAYPIFPNTYHFLKDGFKKEFIIFTLDPSQKICKSVRGDRQPSKREKHNIHEFYKEGIHKLEQSSLILKNKSLDANIKEILDKLTEINALK